MPRWNGGVIGAANNPTSSSAKGIWSLSEATKAIRAGLWPPSNAGADPYFENVTLLLPGDGTNGAQNNTFLDSSTNNFTITRNGNTTQGTFSPFSKADGRWGNFFDGVDDYISVPSISLGTGNFTFEAWQYILPDGTDYGRVCGMGDFFNSTGIAINFNPSTLKFEITNNNSTIITSSSTYSYNTWHHVALVRSGSTITLYINGTSAGTATNSNSLSGIVYVSAINYISTLYYGASFTSNFRLTNTAVYTGAFTPSTIPLTDISGTQVLTCQSNRFIDTNTQVSAKTITIGGAPQISTFSPFPTLTAYAAGTNGGSGYFDGSGDYLDTAYSASLSGNYSVETWFYLTTVSAQSSIFTIGNASASTGLDLYYSSTSNQLVVLTNGSAAITTGSALNPFTWYHIALVRSGSSNILYLNGVQVGSTWTSSTTFSGTFRIGVEYTTTAGASLNGYLSSFRVSDTNRTITIPTAPYTSDANTKLLCNFTNGGIIDTSMSNDLETVGNAQISTTQSKWGGGSIYLDGTGDYLLMRDTQGLAFGTGDFTIEFWVYFNSGLNADIVLYDGRPTSTNGVYPIIYTNSSGKILWSTNSGDRITGTTTLTTGTWYHVAVARSGTSTKLFLNGTQEGSTYTDSNSYLIGANRPSIGTSGYTLGNGPLNGYIDDLRVTKGYARYTSNFTAPTAPFNGFGD